MFDYKLKSLIKFVITEEIYRKFIVVVGEMMRKTRMFVLGAMQKLTNLVELEKFCRMSLWLQKRASIQPRTDIPKFELPVYRYTGSGISVYRDMHRPSRHIPSKERSE